MEYYNKSTLIVFFITLSACGPVMTSKSIDRSATPLTITQTHIPTGTDMPTITNIPSETLTPTETPIPVPEYYHGTPRKFDDFIHITSDEQENLLMADIESKVSPELTGLRADSFPLIHKWADGAYAGVKVSGGLDTQVKVRTGYWMDNPHKGGLPVWKIVVEVAVLKQKEHVYLKGYIGGSGGGDTFIERDAQSNLRGLQNVKAINIDIVTKIYTGAGTNWNPVALDITENAPAADKDLLSRLVKNLSFPDGISSITLFFIDVNR